MIISPWYLLGEDKVAREHEYNSDLEVFIKVVAWVPNIGHTWGHQNQYLQTIDLHWHMKSIVENVVLERNDAKDDIWFILDNIQL